MKRQRSERPAGFEEWCEQLFVDLVSSSNVRALARRETIRLASPDRPLPEAADLEAARPYLKKCLDNMSVGELQELSDEQAAALWARGACGAARYRTQGRAIHGGLHRTGRASGSRVPRSTRRERQDEDE